MVSLQPEIPDFNGYRFIKRLGRGGFGTVYLANPPGLKKRYVAIKVIKRQGGQHEVDILEQLNHNNIVQIQASYDLDHGDSSSTLIVMEYVEGGSLQGLLRTLSERGQSLDYDTILNFMIDVAQALNYIHSRNVLHLDLKPANILLKLGDQANATPKFMLTDFGIAKLVRPNEQLSKSGGTPAYMSPEHFRATSNHLDVRSDIYSLGIILYELVSGQTPFSGSPAELSHQHRNVPPPPLSVRVPGLPYGLEEGIMIMLAKDPNQRYQQVGQAVQMLREVLGATRIESEEPSDQRIYGHELGVMLSKIKFDQIGAAYRLQIVTPNGENRHHEIKHSPIIIGRLPDTDIMLDAKQVSRQHVQIDYNGVADFYITDLGSRHGTYLNGGRLQPQVRHPLQLGDLVDMAGYALNVEKAVHDYETLWELSDVLPSTHADNLIDVIEADHHLPEIEMVINPQIQPLSLGAVHVMTVSITPQNTPLTTYRIQISPGNGIEESWYQIALPRQIPAGSTAHFEVVFTIPNGAAVLAGSYDVSVACVADDSSVPPVVANVPVRILPAQDFDITLHYKEVTQRWLRRGNNTLRIRNNGIQKEHFKIKFEAPDTLRVNTPSTTLEVDAHQEVEVPLYFKPRRSADRYLNYSVKVTPYTGSAKERNGTYVTRKRRSLPPLTTVIFLALFLAILLALADQFILDSKIRTMLFDFLPFLEQFVV